MNRIALMYLAAVSMIAAPQNGAVPAGNPANGKVLFTKIGCFQCHGYAGQGGRAGASLVPMALKEAVAVVRSGQPALLDVWTQPR